MSGRHLGTSRRSCSTPTAAAGSRPTRSPSPAARSRPRSPTAPRPGRPKVTDSYDNSAKSPTDAEDRRARPDPALRAASSSGRPPRSRAGPTTTARRSRSVTYMFTNSEPTDVRIDVVKRPTARSSTAGSSTRRSRTRSTRPNGTGSGTARASPLATAPTSSASAPRAAAWSRPPMPGSTTTASSSRFAAATATATGSAPRGRATPTRDRTSWPDAAPRWWRPAAAGCSGRPTRRAAPATTW